MSDNQIFAYSGEDFRLMEEISDSRIPYPHRKAIRRELEKLRTFPYGNLIPPQKLLKGMGTIAGGVPLYALRPHCPNKVQYRFPLVSSGEPTFLILGFFTRKDANFNKQIQIAEERYRKIQTYKNLYELIDLQNDLRI